MLCFFCFWLLAFGFWLLAFGFWLLPFGWHPRIRIRTSGVAPVRGGTYFSLQRQRKVGKRKPLLYLRCPPGSRFSMPQLSRRAATSALRRKPAVQRARREKPTQSGAHTAAIRPRASAKNVLTECAPGGCHLSRRARLTAGFLRRVCVAARQLKHRVPWRYPGGHRRFEAAFFCLLFFAAAKKSRCRPAQGQRMKHRYEIADANQKIKGKSQKQKPKAKRPEWRLASQTKKPLTTYSAASA
ncbi:hypothetical protein LMG24235_06945 [Paraburkholderia sabiae]|nr:hypothetical protein LMG24235_06945 [Paraburkholderia sabiae]